MRLEHDITLFDREGLEAFIILAISPSMGIDLRKQFGLEVLKVGERNRDNLLLVVDAVTEVLRIPAQSVEPPSSLVTTADSEYITGIAKLEERLIILFNLERILMSYEDLNELEESEAAVAAIS
jgi:chemotaxis signal transduction protein